MPLINRKTWKPFWRYTVLENDPCMFYVYAMCMFCIVFNLCAKFELVKSPEVTLSGWQGYKPTINNNNNNNLTPDSMYTSRLKVSDAYVACSKIVSGLIIAGTIWSVFNIHLFRCFFLAVQLCLSTNVPNYMYIYNTHMHARLHTHRCNFVSI